MKLLRKCCGNSFSPETQWALYPQTYSLENLRPIRIAEAFEAVDYLPQRTWPPLQ